MSVIDFSLAAYYLSLVFHSIANQKCFTLRACSHEPGTVNSPGLMIAPGQALPLVYIIIYCPGASLSPSDHYEFI